LKQSILYGTENVKILKGHNTLN